MNFPFFVAQRIRSPQKASFSATVSRIGVASIALGIAVGIVSLAVLVGFRKNIEQKVFLFGAHLKISKISLNEFYQDNAISYDYLKNILQRQSNVAYFQPSIEKVVILKSEDDLEGVFIKGVDAGFHWPRFAESIVAGKAIDFKATNAQNQVVLSKKIADNLKLGVGSSVLMYSIQNPPRVRKLQVVGLYETFVEEFDTDCIVGNMALPQKLNDWPADSVSSVDVYLNDFSQIDQSAYEINKALPSDLRVSRVTDRFSVLFDWLKLVDQNTAIFLSLILFVACFNVIAVLLVMMVERTQMIGLLKTLGSPNPQIRRIFFLVGLRLTAVGLLLGNVIGLGLCWAQAQFKIVRLDPVNYVTDHAPIYFDWWAFGWLNVGMLVVIAVILLLPTLVISKINPIQALLSKR